MQSIYSKVARCYSYFKPICRLCLLILFVISTISITLTWTSMFCFVCLSASYIISLISRGEVSKETLYKKFQNINPYKGKIGKGTVDSETEKKLDLALRDYILYNAAELKSLKNFEQMKSQSDCIFAKKSKVWGSPDYDERLSLEDNIKSIYPTFLQFTICFEDLGLDAFVIELPGHLYGCDIKVFGDGVRRTLLTLKNCDYFRKWKLTKRLASTTSSDSSSSTSSSALPPRPLPLPPRPSPFVDETDYWCSSNWVFEINRVTFFITSFAPFYPNTNSRYNFGLRDCYILFQPEISFAIHDLPPDTAVTNWERPVTVRDKIRKAFYESGREYTVPFVMKETMAYEILRRIEPEDEPTKWWENDDSVSKNVIGHEKKE